MTDLTPAERAADIDEYSDMGQIAPAYRAAAQIAESWYDSTSGEVSSQQWRDASQEIADAVLDAATWAIAAETLRDLATELREKAGNHHGCLIDSAWLDKRADELERQTDV